MPDTPERVPSEPKVCFISSHAQLGGSELVLHTLLEGLPANVISSVIVLQDGPLNARLRPFSPDIISTGAQPITLLRSARKVRSHVRGTRPQLVHANGVKAALVAVLARPKVPILWMKHDFSFDGRVGRWLGSKMARVIGVSHAVLEEIGPSARTAVVYPATTSKKVERTKARAELFEKLSVDPNTKLVGLLGRLHPSKGHKELVTALPELARRASPVHLVFAGGEDPSATGFKDEVAAAAEGSGHAASITFLGHVEHPERVIAGLDVLVIPSVRSGRFGREGFGLTAVEAMSCGTPVVAYDSGALREVLGDCGILVPEGDHRQLGSAIQDVLENDALRTRLTTCGIDRAAERFSVTRMLELMEEQYRECIREA